jgi:transposase
LRRLRSKAIRPEIALQENRDLGFLRLAIEPLLAEVADRTAETKASLADAGDSVRIRFVAAVAAGGGTKATAKAMDVPYREAKRWVEVWRETGAVAARKFGYRSKLDDHEDFLRQLVVEQPDIKLTEIHESLGERGVTTSKTSVWNALQRFGIELADQNARHAADVQAICNPNSASSQPPGKERT